MFAALLTTLILAQPPDPGRAPAAVGQPAAGLVITGPARVPAYKLVRLAAAGADPDAALLWDVDREDAIDALEVDGGYVFTGPPGVYRIKLRAVKGKTAATARLTVTIGDAPPAPPAPGPKPDPKPTPAKPVAFLVVVEETADAVAGRGAFFADKPLADRVKAKGLRWRVVDKDVVGADGKPPADVARFLALAANKPYPSLFLVAADGGLIDQRPVPRTPADLLSLLTQFGG